MFCKILWLGGSSTRRKLFVSRNFAQNVSGNKTNDHMHVFVRCCTLFFGWTVWFLSDETTVDRWLGKASCMPIFAANYPAFSLVSTSYFEQMAVRLVLGLMSWLAFRCFNSAAALRFGDPAAAWSAAAWALQFHLPFYLSRTLPNVFALCVVLLALQVGVCSAHRGWIK